jgi:hypothetical protein
MFFLVFDVVKFVVLTFSQIKQVRKSFLLVFNLHFRNCYTKYNVFALFFFWHIECYQKKYKRSFFEQAFVSQFTLAPILLRTPIKVSNLFVEKISPPRFSLPYLRTLLADRNLHKKLKRNDINNL